jgi:FkbM family methyltransferase
MNTKALQKAIDLSKYADNFKSRILLFIIGVLNQASSWKRTNAILKFISSFFSSMGILPVRVRKNSKTVNFSLRINNNSDYQSLFECFAGMYKIPEKDIHNILDGGANIGFFTINTFLNNTGVREIVCVEPNPANLEFLIPNTTQLPAKIIKAAMSNFNGTATFNFKEHNTGHIQGSPGHAYFHEQTQVDCVTIAGIIPKHWDMKHTLVKLDIEGQEYKVFADMFNSGFFPAYVAAELHDYLHAGGEELVATFKKHGYAVHVEGTGEEGNVCRQIFAERKTA